jgi:predicted ester cyclase
MKRSISWSVFAIGLCWATSGLAVEGPDDREMTTHAQNLAHVRSLVAAFNRQDAAACTAHFAESAVWRRGDGSSLQGREGFESVLQGFFTAFPDATITPAQLLAFESGVVLVEWDLEGTHLGDWSVPGRAQPIPATGRAVQIVGANLVGFNASGEIEWDELRIDTAGLVNQLGVVRGRSPNPAELLDFAERYTAAWNSQIPAAMAGFFAEDGSLSINGGPPAVGREALAAVARSFMTGFPDMKLLMDGLHVQGDRGVYRWTFVGTNTGPGGTGKAVRFSGYEVWKIGADGLIAKSSGHFDSGAYFHQLEVGVRADPSGE